MPWVLYTDRSGCVELIHRTVDAFKLDHVSEFAHLPPEVAEADLVQVEGIAPRLQRQVEDAREFLKGLAADEARKEADREKRRLSEVRRSQKKAAAPAALRAAAVVVELFSFRHMNRPSDREGSD